MFSLKTNSTLKQNCPRPLHIMQGTGEILLCSAAHSSTVQCSTVQYSTAVQHSAFMPCCHRGVRGKVRPVRDRPGQAYAVKCFAVQCILRGGVVHCGAVSQHYHYVIGGLLQHTIYNMVTVSQKTCKAGRSDTHHTHTDTDIQQIKSKLYGPKKDSERAVAGGCVERG